MRMLRLILLGAVPACASAPASASRDVDARQALPMGAPIPPRNTSPGDGTRGIVLRHEGESAPPPDWSQVSVSVTIEARLRDHGACFLQSGARVRSGDHFALLVGVARPAYVYVVQASPDQTASVLYPAAGTPSLHLEPQRTYRVPENAADSFELDEHAGIERFAVIASERPLDAAAPELAELMNGVRAKGRLSLPPVVPTAPAATRAHVVASAEAAPPTTPERLPPDPNAGIATANGLTRGILLSTGDSGRALDVKEDEGHVAAALIELDHVP